MTNRLHSFRIALVTITAVFLASNTSAAYAADISADPNTAQVQSALMATAQAIASESNYSYSITTLMGESAQSPSLKQAVSVIVTPAASEISSHSFTTTDNGATWQQAPAGLGDIQENVVGDTAYVPITSGQQWDDAMNTGQVWTGANLQKRWPGSSWASTPASSLVPAGGPMNTVSISDTSGLLLLSAAQAIQMLSSTTSDFQPVTTESETGSTVYKFLSTDETASGTFVIDTASNSLSSYVISISAQGQWAEAEFKVNGIGSDQVTAPTFQAPTSGVLPIRTIALAMVQAYIDNGVLKIARDVISATNKFAKAHHVKISAALVQAQAKAIVKKNRASSKNTATGLRIALKASWEKVTGHACVVVARGKLVAKTC